MIASLAPVPVTDAAAVEVVPVSTDTTRKRAAVLYNDGPNTAYLGGRDVTSLTGTPLVIGATYIDDEVDPAAQLFARCAAGQTASIRRNIAKRRAES